MVAQTVETIAAQVRPSEITDMPAGLTTEERGAYVRGYSRGCATFTKKNGAPGISGAVPAPAPGTPERVVFRAKLAELTTAHLLERQDTAHRAGMAALRKYRKTHGLEAPAAPRKPAARKTRTPAAAAPVDEVPAAPVAPVIRLIPASDVAPEPVAAPEPPATEQPRPANRTKRAARKQLAEEMRARGEDPTDPTAWAAAKLAAGIK